MDEACSTYEMHNKLQSENQKRRDHLRDLVADGRIMLTIDLDEGVDWIHLTQDKDQWRVLVNMIRHHRIP